MSKGILLFAFNADKTDYFKMAVATAKRANHFLNLPVSVVTDKNTDITKYDYTFDNIIIQESDPSNTNIHKEIWINKGRYKAYDVSPYDETLLLDTDYLINSNTLLKPFELYDDFMCHNSTSFLMVNEPPEYINPYSYKTLWATVMYFKKTLKTKQLFECMKMVQDNYPHYITLHKLISGSYRNDYALTFALRILYGQLEDKSNYIPWNLSHAGKGTIIYKNNDDIFNTEYTVIHDNWKNGKIRKEYGIIRDVDFHMMNKNNIMELLNE